MSGLEARESATVLERKVIALQTEIEDVRSLLETVRSSSLSHQPYGHYNFCTVLLSRGALDRPDFKYYANLKCTSTLGLLLVLKFSHNWLCCVNVEA